MSDRVTFALPTAGSAAMSTADQQSLVVNQATAVIVSAWLEHATAAVQAGVAGFTVNSVDLQGAIDRVQAALRS